MGSCETGGACKGGAFSVLIALGVAGAMIYEAKTSERQSTPIPDGAAAVALAPTSDEDAAVPSATPLPTRSAEISAETVSSDVPPILSPNLLLNSPPVATPGDASSSADSSPPYETFRIRGKIVYLNEALARRFNIRTVEGAQEQVIALEAHDGQIYPIVENDRGRAFRKDPRLWDMELEMLVRRFVGSPMVQIVVLYQVQDDGLYELDYWCDVCSIPMFELKPCDCCQGPTRLRLRKVELLAPDGPSL